MLKAGASVLPQSSRPSGSIDGGAVFLFIKRNLNQITASGTGGSGGGAGEVDCERLQDVARAPESEGLTENLHDSLEMKQRALFQPLHIMEKPERQCWVFFLSVLKCQQKNVCDGCRGSD